MDTVSRCGSGRSIQRHLCAWIRKGSGDSLTSPIADFQLPIADLRLYSRRWETQLRQRVDGRQQGVVDRGSNRQSEIHNESGLIRYLPGRSNVEQYRRRHRRRAASSWLHR